MKKYKLIKKPIKHKLERKISKRHSLLSDSKIKQFNLKYPQLEDCIQGIKSSSSYSTTFESPFQGKVKLDTNFRTFETFKNTFINLIINKSPKIVRIRRKGSYIIVCCKSKLSKDLRYIIFSEDREYLEKNYDNQNQKEEKIKHESKKRKFSNVKGKRKSKRRNKKKGRKSKT